MGEVNHNVITSDWSFLNFWTQAYLQLSFGLNKCWIPIVCKYVFAVESEILDKNFVIYKKGGF